MSKSCPNDVSFPYRKSKWIMFLLCIWGEKTPNPARKIKPSNVEQILKGKYVCIFQFSQPRKEGRELYAGKKGKVCIGWAMILVRVVDDPIFINWNPIFGVSLWSKDGTKSSWILRVMAISFIGWHSLKRKISLLILNLERYDCETSWFLWRIWQFLCTQIEFWWFKI